MTDLHTVVPGPVATAPSSIEPDNGALKEPGGGWAPSRLVLGNVESQRLGPRLGLIACGWAGLLIGLADIHEWAGLLIGPGGFAALAVWAHSSSRNGEHRTNAFDPASAQPLRIPQG